ncbi:hypothetical protein BZG02_19510 [Labilibaculum filiforme]|uniref:Uncharacterized protein n=1 Tax=Labilibaculum filiforme TaxID=1940526 RepID=A0A2N3HQQ2_9BACT|nr:hypothetical protein [Labilibaculum filiforme]PKQ60373.1 hypothetical protein BZG02_19510 [Labilibaculum filiforme]
MKNRNTKDVAENHIYPFIISNFILFAAIFFSLNNADEAAILLYSMALNLFTNWFIFYAFQKKKLIHFSEYYNNLVIGIFSIAAILPVFLLIVPIVLFPEISHLLLLFASWILALLFNKIILKNYTWEKKAEQHMNKYRMNIEESKEKAFVNLKQFIDQSGRDKFANYLEKNQMFDRRMEAYLNT